MLGEANLALTLGKAGPIIAVVLSDAMQATHPFDIAGLLAISGSEGFAAGMAQARFSGFELVVHRDPLVEDEALPRPTAGRFRHGFQVAQDAALEMVDPRKTLLQQIGRGLFAADTPGAKHGDLLGLALLNQGAEPGFHPLGELPKAGGTWIDGPGKAAEGHLVAIAGIDHQGVWIRNQGVPLLRRHMGANRGAFQLTVPQVGLHRGAAHAHNFALEPHLQPIEGLLLRHRRFDLQLGQPRIAPQLSQEGLHPRGWSTHGAVDTLGGQQHRALHLGALAQLNQPLAPRGQLLLGQGRKAIKSSDYQPHRPSRISAIPRHPPRPTAPDRPPHRDCPW